MSEFQSFAEMAVERIRIFFPLPEEECIAVALTKLFGRHGGDQIVELTPDLTMGEVLDLAQDHEWTTGEFEHMLELAGIPAFDDDFEQMTFREFVRFAARRRAELGEQEQRD